MDLRALASDADQFKRRSKYRLDEEAESFIGLPICFGFVPTDFFRAKQFRPKQFRANYNGGDNAAAVSRRHHRFRFLFGRLEKRERNRKKKFHAADDFSPRAAFHRSYGKLDFAVFDLGNQAFDNRFRAVGDFTSDCFFKNKILAIENGVFEFDFPAFWRGVSVSGDTRRAEIYLVRVGKSGESFI